MKTPFPAYFFDCFGAPFHSVRVRRCEVLSFSKESGCALIACGSLGKSGKFEQWVPLHALASNASKATEKFQELLPTLTPDEEEQSAVPEMAGQTSGAQSPTT